MPISSSAIVIGLNGESEAMVRPGIEMRHGA